MNIYGNYYLGLISISRANWNRRSDCVGGFISLHWPNRKTERWLSMKKAWGRGRHEVRGSIEMNESLNSLMESICNDKGGVMHDPRRELGWVGRDLPMPSTRCAAFPKSPNSLDAYEGLWVIEKWWRTSTEISKMAQTTVWRDSGSPMIEVWSPLSSSWMKSPMDVHSVAGSVSRYSSQRLVTRSARRLGGHQEKGAHSPPSLGSGRMLTAEICRAGDIAQVNKCSNRSLTTRETPWGSLTIYKEVL